MLEQSVGELFRIGKERVRQLRTLGIETCRDILEYFPFRFEDYSQILPIARVGPSMSCTIHGKIVLIANRRSRARRMIVTEALIADQSGQIKAVWFHQPFLTRVLAPGDCVQLSGTTNENFLDVTFINPLYEKKESDDISIHTGRILPIYSLTHGLSQKQFRSLVHAALERCLPSVVDWLPDDIRAKEKLCELSQAFPKIHFPKSEDDIARARARLGFDELFLFQLRRLLVRTAFQNLPAISFPLQKNSIDTFLHGVPFSLTKSQKQAAWEIMKDLGKKVPMSRLLEGDVGSGKTVVALLAASCVANTGYQVAYMAPTDLLARQVFASAKALLGGCGVQCALISGGEALEEDESSVHAEKRASMRTRRRRIYDRIASGDIQCVVGTHALLEESVRFKNLGLVIIDEQHRFGVAQRKLLREKNSSSFMPHLLSLSATPIPRSLALTFYGDLDISRIEEKIPGQKSVITKLVPQSFREWTYAFVRKHIARGRQAFVICPAIDPSDALGVRSATEEYTRLSNQEFRGFQCALIHGKLKKSEQESIMRAVRAGEIDVLVSTSVIEVGIDIPNATVVMIEGAERFGIAQLHQFRGRVGRGTHQSYCFLLPITEAKEQHVRLSALVECDNGFELAEKDLAFRGEGELFGYTQSGMPNFSIASLKDQALIARARAWAETYAKKIDAFPLLKARVEVIESNVHFE